jgi:hypothetical protein
MEHIESSTKANRPYDERTDSAYGQFWTAIAELLAFNVNTSIGKEARNE